ncbi:unnamed protein product [Durusdinium trenchii]
MKCWMCILASNILCGLSHDFLEPSPGCLRFLNQLASDHETERRNLQNFVRHSLAESMDCASAAIAKATVEDALLLSRLAEEVAQHPRCMQELDTKSEAETRCAQKWYKIGIHVLVVHGLQEAAEQMWHRAKAIRTVTGATIGWTSLLETPTVWVSSLESMPFWDCSTWPFLASLEAASSVILDEVQKAAQFTAAYPYLKTGGVWQDIFLYRGHDWNSTLCDAMPRTCRLLLPELPTKPGVPYATVYNEEVVIFRSEPGATVGAHCGSSNAIINLHLTLKGGRGTSIAVGDERIFLEDGKAVCFQDSFFHAVQHEVFGEDERISMVLRVMHPQMSLDVLEKIQSTDMVPDLRAFSSSESLLQEVYRLRQEYRKLALISGDGTTKCASPL